MSSAISTLIYFLMLSIRLMNEWLIPIEFWLNITRSRRNISDTEAFQLFGYYYTAYKMMEATFMSSGYC